MHKESIFKKALSGVLATLMVTSSLMGYAPTTVKADISTQVSDESVSGTGSKTSVAKGNWCCQHECDYYYSIRPVVIENPYIGTGNVELGASGYYQFADLALYVTNSSNTDSAYTFSSGTTRCAGTMGDRTLNNDGSFDFSSALGVDLDLPTQKFSSTEPTYNSFSTELSNKIITSGENSNIVDILNNYITYLDSNQSMLSTNGIWQLQYLKQYTGWGTDSFSENALMLGLCIDVGSFSTSGSSTYAFSWIDLHETCVTDDAYFVYETFKNAEDVGSLLSWSGTHADTGRVYTSSYNGMAVFLAFNDPKVQKANYTQALNITLSFDGDLKSDTNTSDITVSYDTVTSAKNPDVELGSTTYTGILDNAFNNSLTDVSIPLYDGGTLDTSKESDSLKTLSGRSDYDGLTLYKYDVLKAIIDASIYDFSDMDEIDLSSVLSGVTAKTKANAVSNGFGNLYTLEFESDSSVRSDVADSVSKVSGVSTVDSYNNLTQLGTISNMADLQAAALLSGNIEGTASDSGLSTAKGNSYVTISYLGKDIKVTGKNAEVYINKDAGVETVQGIASTTHSVTASHDVAITGKSKSYTYAIAWKSDDYDLTDEKALTSAMLESLGKTYIIRSSGGASVLKNAFESVTGVEALGVKYITEEKAITVGSSAQADGTLTGVNVLVINVSTELPVRVESEDYVDSNELNFIYQDLRGNKSTTSSIIPMEAGTVTDIVSGDLVSFKGNNVHYYFEPTGLFGVFSQSIKSFDTTSYPSYSYNISRALWGDNLVASNYRGISATDSSVQSDILNNLGLSIGAKGVVSSVTSGENADETVAVTKKDIYSFKDTLVYKNETVDLYNIYTVKHSLNKYTCLDLDTALNSYAGKSPFTIQNTNGLGNKVTMVTQSANTLTVYPEVAYKYYKAETSNGVLSNVKPLTVYVMGEKARTMKPSSIRGIDLDYASGLNTVASGKITSSGAMVGSNANAVANGKMVVAQGSDITMTADHLVNYRLISYSLDVVDTYGGVAVRNEFSSDNASYNPEVEHETYVQEFIDNVEVQVHMTIGSKEYDMMTSNNTPFKSANTSSTYFVIEFHDGVIDEASKSAIINDIATEYGITQTQAKEMFKQAGFEAQLQAMFESNTDTNNGSKNKWYDEESVTICIRKYVTDIDLNQVFVQDKIDYGVVSDGSTVDATFSMSVYLPEQFNGCNLVNANKLFTEQGIQGVGFRVSAGSTSDFGKN